MRTARITIYFALVVLFCIPLSGFASAQGALTGSAQMRIGYFAIHPKAFDTYIDGELASFVPGLTQLSDVVLASRWQHGSYQQYVTTPFMNLPTGSHSIAFVPVGESLDTAILGPEEIVLEDDHVYSIAVIGRLENDTLNVLVIDETGATAAGSPAANVFVHDIVGAPPLTISMGGNEVTTGLEYGQYAIYTWPSRYGPRQSGVLRISETNDPDTVLFQESWSAFDGNSSLIGLTGLYPGGNGESYHSYEGQNTPGDIPTFDRGAIDIGDVVSGELLEAYSRDRYTLTLDAASTLNIYVNHVGRATAGGSIFDTYVFIYDGQDHLLLWNDDRTGGSANAGIEDYELAAGTYVIEVGGFADFYAGAYELRVETAASD